MRRHGLINEAFGGYKCVKRCRTAVNNLGGACVLSGRVVVVGGLEGSGKVGGKYTTSVSRLPCLSLINRGR